MGGRDLNYCANPSATFSYVLHEIGKGTGLTSPSVRHVPSLTERSLYNRDFCSYIIIGWILLTNVPRVHKIIYRSSFASWLGKNRLWNTHGYYSCAQAYSARLTTGNPSRLTHVCLLVSLRNMGSSMDIHGTSKSYEDVSFL